MKNIFFVVLFFSLNIQCQELANKKILENLKDITKGETYMDHKKLSNDELVDKLNELRDTIIEEDIKK